MAPRQPTRRRSSPSVPWPVSYSRFGRFVSLMNSARRFKKRPRRMADARTQRSDPSTSGNERGNRTLDKKKKKSESSEDEDSQDVVQADFVFFDPKPGDFHGVKMLLKTYLDNKRWDLSGFVDLILGQTTVGTVVKIDGDEDETPYAVVTALNLKRYQGHRCILELKEFLMKVCQDKNIGRHLAVVLGAHDVGLLVSQRVVNLPLPLLPPLYDGLFNEVSWATEDEPTAELRNYFRFKWYLLVSKIYTPQKKVDQKKKQRSDSEEEIIYVKPEDELFRKLSLWSFTFPLHVEEVIANELKNYQPMGIVVVVQADKIPRFREQLRSLVNES